MNINFREIDFCVGIFIAIARYVMCVIAAGNKPIFAKSLEMYQLNQYNSPLIPI